MTIIFENKFTEKQIQHDNVKSFDVTTDIFGYEIFALHYEDASTWNIDSELYRLISVK